MRAKYNTSIFLMVTILVSNFLPVFSVVAFAEGEEVAPVVQEIAAPVETQSTQETGNTQVTENVLENTEEQNPPLSPLEGRDSATTTEATSTNLTSEDIEDLNTTSETTATTTGFENLETGTDTNSTSTTYEMFFVNSSTTTSTAPIFEFGSSATTTLGTTTTSTNLPNPSLEEGLASSSAENLSDIATSTLPLGTTTIETGEAVATANVLNILNTNLINSTGTIQMANLTNGHDGDLDLRGGGGGTAGSGTCTLTGCNGVDSVTANIISDANIENTLVMQASSGGNLVETAQGGIINTGNTLAGLNLVNVANVNLIDSNYFLLSLNSFRNINGDIILPSLTSLFSLIMNSPNMDLSTISTIQNATLDNNLDVNANTGLNNSEHTLSSLTDTGNANSATNVYNNINSNMFGGKSVAILLRVTGKWLGQLLGLPEGTAFEQDGNLYTLLIEDGTTSGLNPGNTSDIYSTSTARIINDVVLLADSGNNRIANTESALINTGDSFAGANIVNIANTNIVGKSWMLAVINIFGDFNGDIVFGRPDLLITHQVIPNGQVNNDTQLVYKLKIKNKGDRKAVGVLVNSNFDEQHLDILNSSNPYTLNASGDLSFEVGDLSPGEVKEIDFSGKIKNTTPGFAIVNIAKAILSEKDHNPDDNIHTSTINTYAPSFGGSSNTGDSQNNSQNTIALNYLPNASNTSTTSPILNPNFTANNFEVKRLPPDITINGASSTAHQKILVRNLSNTQINGVTFYDIIYNQNGEQVQRESWDLGNVLANEDIELNYDVSFGPNAVSGIYSMSSELVYQQGQKLYFSKNGSITLIKENNKIKKLDDLIKVSTSTLVAYNSTGDSKLNFTTGFPNGYGDGGSMNGPNMPQLAIADYAEITPEDTPFWSSNYLRNFRNLLAGDNFYYTLFMLLALIFSSIYRLKCNVNKLKTSWEK